MKVSPDDFRREASLVEQIAEVVSLLSDKQELLAEARSLRQRAAEIEVRIVGLESAQTDTGCVLAQRREGAGRR